ncbi:thiamine pyrophosphate-binding protein [Poseidonocella sedimentorum]|uniref:Acetolactate synthase large subunit n=1 Tax=Poseidonocella sedimentorum TaxID=871652 RepID=A0A1I6ECP4_9RHOB|nr:thiamine pyrophosphate-binding protein [Poseidonocella sedimentorum]SFR15504.1 Acetolactate synthase large subunit [Poseidonocella sedimentorum]
MTATPHVFETLAEGFAAEGVETCFALLGDANMAWAAALAARGVRMVYLRHEHCTVAAATAWARKTGRVGIASVTCGPGLTQVLTALPAAVRARIPLVIFAGESPLGAAWYNQAIDQAPFITATGARYCPLHHIPRMADGVRDAFVEAIEERVPVVLGVPFDLQSARPETPLTLPPPAAEILPRLAPMPPHPEALTDAAARISQAGKVVVMAGLGAAESGAGPACAALADRIGALLCTTLPARGLFHGEAFSMGVAGGFSTAVARAAFAEADLVVALGCRLTQHNLDKGKLFPKADILQIDTAPRARSQGMTPAQHHLRGDARLTAEALAETLPARPGWRSPALARAIAETPADTATFATNDGLLDPRDVVTALDALLPQGWQMVNSSGHCSYFFAQMDRPYDRFLTIREFGAIGNGLSYAMGVAAARPEDTVVLFDGDGSLLMHAQELESIRREGMNILICALNDSAYGSEIHKLRDEGLSEEGAVFGETDLAAIARGFGLGGHRVTDLSALPELIAEFTESGGAALWDFPISDKVASPVIRRAHPGGHVGTEHPVSLELDA